MIALPFDSPHRRSAILIEQAGIEPGQRVLDASLYGRVGHGTVFLPILAKRACPQATVVGLYDDPRVLKDAKKEICAAALPVELYGGKPWSPPFEPMSFSVILSSLRLHHMPTTDKLQTLRAFHTLLAPGGKLHVVDWTRPETLILAVLFLGVRISDGFRNTSDHVAGRLAPMMEEAGFAAVEERRREIAIPGCLGFYRATKAA